MMHNLLVLYNPYYQKDVIEQHIKVLQNANLQENAKVAFGKIRSKLRDYDHPYEQKLLAIYDSVTEENYLQLFLTDYSSVYVAKVIDVREAEVEDIAPSYYKEKGLEVEKWFIISDMRRVVHNDFEQARDRILANFTTPNFGNHHYAVYGNSYVYPLVVEMDNPIDYFEYEEANYRYFTEIFKNERTLEVKRQLIHFRFGKEVFYRLHPNTQDAIVSAEIEYMDNRNDPLYDFTAVVVKLSKAFEKELYLFLRELFIHLIEKEPDLADLSYGVQGLTFSLQHHRYQKPNLGTHGYLLKHKEIKSAISEYIKKFSLKYFIFSILPKAIKFMQPIRNETVHGESASLKECDDVRGMIVGIGQNGILCELVNKKIEVKH
jgi:hypothetical protein